MSINKQKEKQMSLKWAKRKVIAAEFLRCDIQDIEQRGINIYQNPIYREKNEHFSVAITGTGNVNVFDTTPYKTAEDAIKAFNKRGY